MAGFGGQRKMILREPMHNLAFHYDFYD